jgi:dynein heavy chain
MNPYMRNFFDKLLEIEKTAKQVLEIVLEFENLQNKWVFLSNVLVGSISEGLNSELKIWSNVDKFFKFITKTIHDNPQVVSLVLREGLLQQLRKMNIEIDNVRDGLYRFLEAKRQAFPRLYFLSNEELMQIYGS